jgi:hypothetical protein
LDNNNGSAGFLDTNEGKQTHQAHDFAAIEWDLSSNKWSTHYLTVTEELRPNVGIMAWPFATAIYDSTMETQTPLNDDIVNVWQEYSSGYDFGEDKTITLTNSSSEQTTSGVNSGYWFALTNPYVGNLSLNLFFANTDNAGVFCGHTAYLYNDSTTSWTPVDYLSSNPVLSPSGAFMAAVSNPNTNTTINAKFTRSMINTSETFTRYKSIANNRIRFISKANGSERECVAVINENAGNEFEINDAYILFSDNRSDFVEPYFVVDNNRIYRDEFNSFPYITPINFHSSRTSEVEFSVEDIPSDIRVSIIDLQNDNSETILNNGERFDFIANEGENEGRYKIKFAKYSSFIAGTQESKVSILNNNREIAIKGENLQDVEVINALGQIVYNKKISGNEYTFTLRENAGAYIIKVKTSDDEKASKIIVK